MNRILVLALAGSFTVPVGIDAQVTGDHGAQLTEWPVEWGGRTRDPYVSPDQTVWFVGQAGNYVARLDPADGSFRRYEIEDGTNPHTVIVDDQGFGWYAGNRNGRIGRIDPESGEVTVFMTGEARDPHTMVFDGQGHIWFTSQQSNRVGRLNMGTGEVEIITPYASPSRPYGIVLDDEGHPWVMLLGAPHVARIDPATLEVTLYDQADRESRGRRLEWTPDNKVWYVDEARGYLGRIDVDTREVTEWLMPGGEGARPYAITKDGQGRLWISETGPEKRLVAFDPATEEFFSVNDVSQNIRHMNFDRTRGAMWFGTDANFVGRIVTQNLVP
jgi:virginiamycin B lyase